MSAVDQLELRSTAESTDAYWWRRWREAMQEEIDRLHLKEVAFSLDAKPSDINNGLAERDRHYFHGEWMCWLISRSPRLAQLAAEQTGQQCVKAKPMSAEEKVKRYERELTRLGAAGKAIKQAALSDDE